MDPAAVRPVGTVRKNKNDTQEGANKGCVVESIER